MPAARLPAITVGQTVLLGGSPGIHSARWAGPDKNFARAMRAIDQMLRDHGATTPALRKRLDFDVGAVREVLIESATAGRTEHFVPVAIAGAAPGTVKRLFEDYVDIEKAYFRKTRIFPIMHTVVIRREVYEANRWIAQSLTKAFIEAQRRTYEDLYETAALKAMLPWLTAHVEDARREFGNDWWSYGLENNLNVLETFTRYHQEQGLSPRKLSPQELFAPESLEAFKI